MPPNKKMCLRSRTYKKPKVPETDDLVPSCSKRMAEKQTLNIDKDISKKSKINLDPRSQKICLNVYKNLLLDGNTARENINTLVSFLTGVSEPMIAKIIEKFDNEPMNKLKKKLQQKCSKNTSTDCIVINNLIQIEKECEPNTIGSIAFYEKKLNKRMHQNITISRDEIINYLNNIGIKWTEETIKKPSTKEIQTKNFEEDISNSLESDNINNIIKEENQEIVIKQEFIIVEDIKLENENIEINDDDTESTILKTEFVEVEDNTEFYFVNQETKEEENKNIKEEGNKDIKEEENKDIKEEENKNIKEEENTNIKEETTEFFDIEDALEPHVISTKSDEDEVMPLEFVNMDQLQHTNEILILEDNQTKHLPSLDYFVLLLQMHSFKYTKNSVAHCLKSLHIKYDSNDNIKSSCSRPISDPIVTDLLKEFNTTFYSNLSEIDPAVKKIITEIGVKYDIEHKIPTFDFILQKVQEYDQNITQEILEIWLKKLSVRFKHTIIKKIKNNNSPSKNSNSQSKNSKSPSKNSKSPSKNSKIPSKNSKSLSKNSNSRSKNSNSAFVHKGTLPTLDYFFENVKKRHYRCTKTTVKKWLKLLCIEFRSNQSDLELVSENAEKLSTPIIKLLIQLEKNFYKKHEPYDEKYSAKNTTDETSKNALPTIDYFYNRLIKANYICHKSSLKKWLDFINIQHDLNEFTGDLLNHQQEELSSPLIKLLIGFDEEFNNLQKSPYRTLIEMLEELDSQFKNKGTLPSLNFIHYYILSAKTLQPNPIYSREYLKEWLKILDINFNIEVCKEPKNFYLESNLGPFFNDDSLPSVNYFYEKLNKKEYVCSRNTLKEWLNILAIKFESSNNYSTESTSKKPEKILNSFIIHTLIKLEDNFNNDKNNFLLLVQMLRHLEITFKMKNEVPTIDYFYKNVITSKFLKNDQAYSKENLKWLLKKLNIDFIPDAPLPPTSNHMPTLDYFQKKLSAKNINFSKIEINAWLKEIGIKFINNSNLDVNERIQALPIEINNALHNIDNEFRLNALITHLKDLEFRLKRKRKYLTFTRIFQIIQEFNLFNTNQNSEHKRTVLKKWVKKLNIKFIDDEEMSQEEVAPLEYYYEKITSIKGNICSKSTLSHWLTKAGIIFRKTNDIIEDIDEQPLEPNILKILWKISKYYCLRDVEPILKKIQDRSISKGETPSLTYLQRKLFDVKGYNYSFFAMRNWLDFVGIKFNNKRTAENNLKEKSKNTDSNNVLMTEPDMETLTENEVITIDEDSKLQENMEVVLEEWPTETIVIEEDDPEANTLTNSDSNIYEKISAPDKVMTLLTEVEYDFYKLRRVPTIEYFYEAMVTKFGSKYSKETLINWLTKAGIRFQGKT